MIVPGRSLAIAYLIAVAVSCLVPPWTHTDRAVTRPSGYAPIFDPPNRAGTIAVDFARLAIQLGGLTAGASAIAFWSARSSQILRNGPTTHADTPRSWPRARTVGVAALVLLGGLAASIWLFTTPAERTPLGGPLRVVSEPTIDAPAGDRPTFDTTGLMRVGPAASP